MFLVFLLDARTTTRQILQTSFFKTDYVDTLGLVDSALGAL